MSRLSSRVTLIVGLLVAAGLLVTACGGGTSSATGCTLKTSAKAAVPSAAGSWPYSNADLANTRDAHGSTISSANVSSLKQSWTFPLIGKAAKAVSPYGSLTVTPIVRGGVVYVQDLDSNVYALALATGKLQWEYECDQPERSGPGPNGVAVVGGTVYGLTPTAAFALNAGTGRERWVDSHLLNSGQGTFGIQPQVANGRVYLASQYGSGPGGGPLLALNAGNGAELWKFNTVVGSNSVSGSLKVGSGGAWETPLVGSDGSVTYGIGNPYQSPASAVAHPSAKLYTDSAVNLDAATGKLRWYYQAEPDDFKDYDLQASPIEASANGAPVVIGAGKMGYVYEMNGRTGRLIWKTAVGQHNGHDNDSRLALERKLRIKAPYTFLPGSLGGVLTNLALAGHTLYLVTNDIPLSYTTLETPSPVPTSRTRATGEVEALDLATGKVQWDTKVPQLPLGAATVSNDLVFTTLYNGALIALNRGTGAVVYRRRLPTSTNSPIAIAGDELIVPAGGPKTRAGRGDPQVVAYTAR